MSQVKRRANRLGFMVAGFAILAGFAAVSSLRAQEMPADAPKDAPAAPRPAGLNLIPWPKSLTLQEGTLTLAPASKIVAASDELKPLADILANEILLATGHRLATAVGKGGAGDIVLKINKDLKADADIYTLKNQKYAKTRDYAHTIVVGDSAVVEGADYRAVAEGTTTLLQALKVVDGKLLLPKMTVKDWPQADFMGIMVDVGRQYITPEALKQSIQACRYYKARYLHLHLSDDQGTVFPFKAFPKLGSRNTAAHGGIAPRVYTLEELKDLVAFADARGVTLVPELETPGHSGAIRLAMPELFDAPKTAGGVAWIAIMNMANDAMYPALDTMVGEICEVFKSSPYFHIGCDETNLGILAGLDSTKEYMAKHNMKGVHELFTQHIRRMNDFVVKRGKKTIVWEGAAVDDAMKDDVIMMTWEGNSRSAEAFQKRGFTTITVPWGLGVPADKWNMYICNGSFLKRTDNVIGALLPMWEMSTEALISSYLKGIAGRQERTWGPDNVFVESEFKQRTAATEARLANLIHTVAIKAEGVKDAKTGVFDEPVTITLTSPLKDADIRYTLDDTTPTATSTKYAGPFKLAKSARVTAVAFDSAGQRVGYGASTAYTSSNYEKNLTTGKKVTASKTEDKYGPENAVDGSVLVDKAWWASPAPQWIMVDLGKTYNLDRAVVFPYWDGNRYYQYTVELSTDGTNWTQVVDMSKNTTPATAQGDSKTFAATPGRYVRVNMLKGSANEGVHLVEVRVYEAK